MNVMYSIPPFPLLCISEALSCENKLLQSINDKYQCNGEVATLGPL